MESNALHLTSPDAWARYEENERLQRYERQVQDYIDNGWMTQGWMKYSKFIQDQSANLGVFLSREGVGEIHGRTYQ